MKIDKITESRILDGINVSSISVNIEFSNEKDYHHTDEAHILYYTIAAMQKLNGKKLNEVDYGTKCQVLFRLNAVKEMIEKLEGE